MNKLSMPEDDLVERGMTEEQRVERRRRLAQWREAGEVEDESSSR